MTGVQTCALPISIRVAFLGERLIARVELVTCRPRSGSEAEDESPVGRAIRRKRLISCERLLDVLASVAAGDMVFPFVDIRKMRSDPLENLTLRERSLLSALGSGHTNSQLAKDFGVSINTIKFHLRNLFEKLDVRNRSQAIALFLEMKHGSWSGAGSGGRNQDGPPSGARGRRAHGRPE